MTGKPNTIGGVEAREFLGIVVRHMKRGCEAGISAGASPLDFQAVFSYTIGNTEMASEMPGPLFFCEMQAIPPAASHEQALQGTKDAVVFGSQKLLAGANVLASVQVVGVTKVLPLPGETVQECAERASLLACQQAGDGAKPADGARAALRLLVDVVAATGEHIACYGEIAEGGRCIRWADVAHNVFAVFGHGCRPIASTALLAARDMAREIAKKHQAKSPKHWPGKWPFPDPSTS